MLVLFLFLYLTAQFTPQSTKFDDRTILTSTVHGFYMFIDAFDMGVCKTILNSGKHNEAIISILLNYLQHKKGFVHVGTHVGLQTLAVASEIKKNKLNSKIYAFQPEFFSFLLLQKSVIFNEFESIVKTHHIGIAGEEGTGEIAVRLTDTSKAEIMKVQTKRRADNKQIVKLLPLNEVIPLDEEIGLALVTGNKMQVEILEQLLVYCELSKELVIISDWKYGINPQKNIDAIVNLVRKLEYLGYEMYEIIFSKKEEPKEYKKVNGFNGLVSIQDSKILFLPSSKSLPVMNND